MTAGTTAHGRSANGPVSKKYSSSRSNYIKRAARAVRAIAEMRRRAVNNYFLALRVKVGVSLHFNPFSDLREDNGNSAL